MSTFRPFTTDLWVAQSPLFATNSGVWVSGFGAILIDPAIYPAEIEAMRDFLAARDIEPSYLILTHSHWDHVFGPQHFPDVPVVAQADFSRWAAAPRAHLLDKIARFEEEADIGRAAPFVIPTPAQTFDAEGELSLGHLRLRLTHAPGHAPDQLTVYDADSGTLWAADMLSDLEIPFVSDSLAAYERTLADLAARDIRALVPGHGAPTTDTTEIRARLADDRAYLAELRERVEGAVGAGKTLDETVAACADMRYRRPDDNAGPHRLNVESAYAELGGAADETAVGWAAAWD
ncbi:MAG: MBL fold metallo-hydrolase [Anaerolineae bacterium]